MSATGLSDRLNAELTRRRRARRPSFDHGPPIAGIDTLPILLFLFALVATLLSLYSPGAHVLTIDFPPPFFSEEALGDELEVRIGIDGGGGPTFNDLRVSQRTLLSLLDTIRTLPREPVVIFTPTARARYGDILPVLGAIKHAGLTKLCFGRLERHRRFDKDARFKPLHLTMLPPAVMPRFEPLAPSSKCAPRLPRPQPQH